MPQRNGRSINRMASLCLAERCTRPKHLTKAPPSDRLRRSKPALRRCPVGVTMSTVTGLVMPPNVETARFNGLLFPPCEHGPGGREFILSHLARASVMCYLIGNNAIGARSTSRVMDIEIPDRKLKKALENQKECRRRFGPEMAKKIQLRLAALQAADSLVDFWPPSSGPERCHELTGNLAGTFSLDLK